MIFRAVFWIGLIALLAPHEPALGLGHAFAGLPTIAISWPAAGHPSAKPKAAPQRSLADVKNEIDASIEARAALAL